MQNINLQWGLPVAPGEYLAAWGARGIIDHREIDLLHDRQDAAGGDAARDALCNWLNKDGIPALRGMIRTDRRANEITIDKLWYTLKASVRTGRSNSGYIYLSAVLRGMETFPSGKWSGAFVPEVGEIVSVKMNGLGKGRVLGFFVEADWVGVIVKLSDPPEWHVRQNGAAALAGVFGCEIKRLEEVEK